ncbi:hypothetical protein SERLA73DRAFT_77376 [Serpula lacrymans var. lacrymans S7.3]|uniref:Uncharacterized protein n=1 Tax=Serpula lacrymans var. lacrymans (strain S7.3) TaxID=936435 RepID=F8Q9T1_SERL3|nr:hypothetical protein SERLA73DRAFT_77376 [Serpula lacrymans var. lacrymans S7.3]
MESGNQDMRASSTKYLIGRESERPRLRTYLPRRKRMQHKTSTVLRIRVQDAPSCLLLRRLQHRLHTALNASRRKGELGMHSLTACAVPSASEKHNLFTYSGLKEAFPKPILTTRPTSCHNPHRSARSPREYHPSCSMSQYPYKIVSPLTSHVAGCRILGLLAVSGNDAHHSCTLDSGLKPDHLSALLSSVPGPYLGPRMRGASSKLILSPSLYI